MKLRLPVAVLAVALACIPATHLVAQPSGDAKSTDDSRWNSLNELAVSLEALLRFDPLTGAGYLLRGQDLLRFRLGTPILLAGGTGQVPGSVRLGVEGLEISPAGAVAIERWFTTRAAERHSHFRVAAILIDPGHGGKDPGAIGEFGSGKDAFRIQEKDVVLDIAKDVYSRLAVRWPDKQILITRSGDTFPTLDERVEMANRLELGLNEAIIYVSIHANASFNKNASGYEVWYLNPEYRRTVVDSRKAEGMDEDVVPILNAMLEEEYTTESIYLATRILDGVTRSIGDASTNRGVRAEEWFVVRNARMPSVLVEVGFVTNEAEARLLGNSDHLRKLGDGIYNGIVDFVGYFEKRRGDS